MFQTRAARQAAKIKINRGFDIAAVNKLCTERGWKISKGFSLATLAGTAHQRRPYRRLYQFDAHRKVWDHGLYFVFAETGKPAAVVTCPYWSDDGPCGGDPHVAAAKCSEAIDLQVEALPVKLYAVGHAQTQTFLFTKKESETQLNGAL